MKMHLLLKPHLRRSREPVRHFLALERANVQPHRCGILIGREPRSEVQFVRPANVASLRYARSADLPSALHGVVPRERIEARVLGVCG